MKKILAVMFLAGCSVALNAATIQTLCTETTAGNNPALGSGQPVVSGSTFTCSPLNIGSGILTGVSITINNSFSGAVGQTNQVNFSYTETGFNGFTTLSTSTYSTTASTTQGAITGPAGTTCVSLDATDISCSETTPTSTSFTITGSDAWVSGSQSSVGSNEFLVTEVYTYSGPAPEPASLMMVGGGLLGLGMIVRRKRKA